MKYPQTNDLEEAFFIVSFIRVVNKHEHLRAASSDLKRNGLLQV